jgi:hypothetical protein
MRSPAPTSTPATHDEDASHGRVWTLFVGGSEAGSFTDLRRRNFNPGERLLDDQGHRRVVVAVLDAQHLQLSVSRPLS